MNTFLKSLLPERQHRIDHDLEREKTNPEAENTLADILIKRIFRKQGERQADPDQQHGSNRTRERLSADREGGADVRTEDHCQGLPEGHQPGAHETHKHHRRRARLDEAGQERSRPHCRKPVARERTTSERILLPAAFCKPSFKSLMPYREEALRRRG
jgi:hypothetical protein